MDKCEHYVNGDDENLLLDDENTRHKKCASCHQAVNIWTNGVIEGNTIWAPTMNGTLHNEEIRPIIIDDQVDNLEDSPLLINECFREPVEQEFHCHNSSSAEDVNARKKLCIASILCFLFMVAELLGGYFAGSLAVMTDAAHLFSDFIGFIISLLAIWIGRKPPTKNMTFGYHRAEVVGAFLSVLTIWLLAAIFSVLAIGRLCHDDYEIDADTMIIIASLGLFINIIMGGILHGVCHTHSHGLSQHSHSSNNINVRAAVAHVLGDFLQSLGVLVAALIIKFYPDAKIADPICTLLFSLIVICTTIRVGKDSIWFLIEGSPINSTKLSAELRRLPSVKFIHNLHIWSLSPGKDAVAVHLAVDQYCDRDLLLKKATSLIRSKISVVSCTVQIEASSLTNSCQQCQSLQC